MSPRRKKEEPAESPSASFLGPDPVFEEDDAPEKVEESKPEPKPASKPEPKPKPKLEAPPPLRTRTREEEVNKCLILFSRDQLAALTEHLKKYSAGLNYELRKEFEQGPLGQVLKNLG